MTRDRRGAIAGVAEAAAILHITRQHLWNLRREDDRFPDVVEGRAGGPVWWVDELHAYRAVKWPTKNWAQTEEAG